MNQTIKFYLTNGSRSKQNRSKTLDEDVNNFVKEQVKTVWALIGVPTISEMTKMCQKLGIFCIHIQKLESIGISVFAPEIYTLDEGEFGSVSI